MSIFYKIKFFKTKIAEIHRVTRMRGERFTRHIEGWLLNLETGSKRWMESSVNVLIGDHDFESPFGFWEAATGHLGSNICAVDNLSVH